MFEDIHGDTIMFLILIINQKRSVDSCEIGQNII